MFNVNDIKEGNDYVIFFKIIEKKYIKNFQQDGQIYFGLLSDYRQMEECGQEEIGDSFEASVTKKISMYIRTSNTEYEQIHGPESKNNITINAHQCAFCFYALGLKCFDKKSDAQFIHKIPSHLLECFCKDKGGVENCAIMIFGDEFIHKIIDKIKNKKLSYMSKHVSYDDYDYIPLYDINSYKYALECCFHKRQKYEYQNEFRIVVLNTKNEPLKDLYIDISTNELQFLELKTNSNFICEIELTPQIIGKFRGVYYDISCFLTADKNDFLNLK